ncbi:MAG: hypothetical protein IJW71_06965 [Clostridia bacterium]|nr:hypothetical protein [Clostridia bacterium]MBQ9806712.1 hypothetical protein [Clostridia bacterium]
MDTTKLFTILCAFLLLISLILSITTLVIMRHALDETAAWQKKASAVVSSLSSLGALLQEVPDTSVSDETPPAEEPSTNVDVLYNRFILKETNGQVGVYSEDGYLIRTIAVQVSTLPKEARDALAEGMVFNSWRELIALIENYES